MDPKIAALERRLAALERMSVSSPLSITRGGGVPVIGINPAALGGGGPIAGGSFSFPTEGHIVAGDPCTLVFTAYETVTINPDGSVTSSGVFGLTTTHTLTGPGGTYGVNTAGPGPVIVTIGGPSS